MTTEQHHETPQQDSDALPQRNPKRQLQIGIPRADRAPSALLEASSVWTVRDRRERQLRSQQVSSVHSADSQRQLAGRRFVLRSKTWKRSSTTSPLGQLSSRFQRLLPGYLALSAFSTQSNAYICNNESRALFCLSLAVRLTEQWVFGWGSDKRSLSGQIVLQPDFGLAKMKFNSWSSLGALRPSKTSPSGCGARVRKGQHKPLLRGFVWVFLWKCCGFFLLILINNGTFPLPFWIMVGQNYGNNTPQA